MNRVIVLFLGTILGILLDRYGFDFIHGAGKRDSDSAALGQVNAGETSFERGSDLDEDTLKSVDDNDAVQGPSKQNRHYNNQEAGTAPLYSYSENDLNGGQTPSIITKPLYDETPLEMGASEQHADDEGNVDPYDD